MQQFSNSWRGKVEQAAELAGWVLTQSAADFETRRTAQQLRAVTSTHRLTDSTRVDSTRVELAPTRYARLPEVVAQLLDATFKT